MIKLSEAIYPTISTIASTDVRRRFLLLLSVAYTYMEDIILSTQILSLKDIADFI